MGLILLYLRENLDHKFLYQHIVVIVVHYHHLILQVLLEKVQLENQKFFHHLYYHLWQYTSCNL
jgi:hypothetical protein